MTATTTAYVENITAILATPYTSIRTYRYTSATDAPTSGVLAVTTTLVAAQKSYTIVDTSGTITSLYRHTYYNTTTFAESGFGQIQRPIGQTLRLIRMEAAKEANLGFEGSCSGAGATTTLIDAVLRDSGLDTAFLEGAWVYRPDAGAAGDKLRRVAKGGYAAATGTLTFDRAYTNAPANAEAYEVYTLFPPVDTAGTAYSWARAVRDGLAWMPFQDEVNLGTGDGHTRRFSLAPFLGMVEQQDCGRLLGRRTDSNSVTWDADWDKNQRWWEFVANRPGYLAVEMSPAPSKQYDVILECQRTDASVYIDTDTTDCPTQKAVVATQWAIFEQANLRWPGRYAGEYAVALQRHLRIGGKQPQLAVKV